jgi:catechol 2,3-dioxygenase-like lactoylglutathione lyase family enzyme
MIALTTDMQTRQATPPVPMQLGIFSVSFAVKDIKASKAFYEKLDFAQLGGKLEQNWVVLQNGSTTLGLFQRPFETNSLTFNPGWDHERKTPANFQDVRDLQRVLKTQSQSSTAAASAKSSSVVVQSLSEVPEIPPERAPMAHSDGGAQHIAAAKADASTARSARNAKGLDHFLWASDRDPSVANAHMVPGISIASPIEGYGGGRGVCSAG